MPEGDFKLNVESIEEAYLLQNPDAYGSDRDEESVDRNYSSVATTARMYHPDIHLNIPLPLSVLRQAIHGVTADRCRCIDSKRFDIAPRGLSVRQVAKTMCNPMYNFLLGKGFIPSSLGLVLDPQLDALSGSGLARDLHDEPSQGPMKSVKIRFN